MVMHRLDLAQRRHGSRVIDSLNGNLTNRLDSAVADLNKVLGKKSETDPSGRPVQRPLVIRAYGNEHTEIMDFVYFARRGFKSGPGRVRLNSVCELLLQLLHVGPHHLPEFSRSELVGLAASIEEDKNEGLERLRRFIAGKLTWDDANDPNKKLDEDGSVQQNDGSGKDIGLENDGSRDDVGLTKTSEQTSKQTGSDDDPQSVKTAQEALKGIIDLLLTLANVLICTTSTAAGKAYKTFVAEADICPVEEAGAFSSPRVFAGRRGIGQPLIISGDGAQFGPSMRDYRKHIFRAFLATSTLDMIKTAGYPVFQLNTQHRAIDGQFDVVYKCFYSAFRSIESPATQHPDNHSDAQRGEAAFVADFSVLEASPADRILPMFIHVPGSDSEIIGKSRHSPQQTKAATYLVKKLVAHEHVMPRKPISWPSAHTEQKSLSSARQFPRACSSPPPTPSKAKSGLTLCSCLPETRRLVRATRTSTLPAMVRTFTLRTFTDTLLRTRASGLRGGPGGYSRCRRGPRALDHQSG